MPEVSGFKSGNLRSYLEEWDSAWKYLSSTFSREEGIAGVMEKRVYFSDAMASTLDKAGVLYIDPEKVDVDRLKKFSDSLGLFSNDNFFLEGRYLLPIKDMLGNVIAAVGWLDDEKKYLTTSSEYFSKSTLFYGLEDIPNCEDKETFVVEGIFDRLSLNSLGFPAFATMGINADPKKRVLYNLMGRVVGIPDCDKEGRKVLAGDLWNLPISASYFRWKGALTIDGEALPLKDIDMLLKVFDIDDMRGILRGVYGDTSRRVVTLEV